jgi:hypothetical protein
LPWVKACSERRLRWPSSPSVGFSYGYLLHVGTPRLGAILQRSVGKHPQGMHLGILMTLAPILDEGVPSLSFRLEGVEQVVPYEY